MITTNKEYRSFDFEQEDEGMKVKGNPVVFNSETVLYEIDGIEYKEKIDSKALDGADLSDIILNIDHEGKPAAKTKNGTLQVEIKADGLYIEADLSKNETGRELYEDIKNGFFDSMSFAFVVDEDEYDKITHTRTIKKIKKCYDVSAVTFPAYNKAKISARSYVEAVAEAEHKASVEAELRKRLILKTYL